MVNTPGTLLAAHQYTASAYTTAAAARTAYENAQPATASLAKKYPLLAVVGDMVSDPDDANRDAEEGTPIAARYGTVSDMVVSSNCTYFVALGDNVYQDGQLSNYLTAYEHTFGRVKAKTLPLPGNHEYQTVNGADYYTYFGQLAGLIGSGGAGGYYAVNVANWRFYAINTSTPFGSGSPQVTWLAADLAANHTRPAIVAWHHPRWTDGSTSAVTDYAGVDYLWQVMYAAGNVQINLVGHDHNYQRWDTLKTTTPAGNTTGLMPDGVTTYPPTTVSNGITQFVAGMGGNGFFTLTPGRPGYGSTNLSGGPGNTGRSTYGHDRAFGVLYLRLGPTSYDWLFRSIDGVDYDSGTRSVVFH